MGSSPIRGTNLIYNIMNNLISSFKFKPIKTKKVVNSVKRISSITQGLVIVDKGVYYCNIFNDDNSSSSGDISLPFTDKSFELKNRETIFTKVYNNEDKKTRIIRTKVHSRTFPGDKNLYIPFAPNWIIKGYIVEISGKRFFDFEDLITVNGF